MRDWVERLKLRMEELKISRETLALELKATRGSVDHYFTGRRVPTLQKLSKLASVLKCDPAWLQFGVEKGSKSRISHVESNHETNYGYCIPILEWTQVNTKNKPKKTISGKSDQITIPNFLSNNKSIYALKIKCDSMKPASNHKHCFHENEIIIVDPTKKPAHGDYVIALLPQIKEATFKQFVVDSGKSFLKPLNPQYPAILFNKKIVICGVVISSVKNF